VLSLALLASCTLPRRDAPPALLSSAAPPGFPTDIRHLDIDQIRIDAAAAAAFERQRRKATGEPIRILALAGGSSGGAFGAGALIGLQRKGERPQFDVVTGVSAGALLAPFAFLGPAWDRQLRDAFTSGRAEEYLGKGQPESSTARGAHLKALVNHYITRQVVDAVAREAASGRVLLVVTTDLDKQEPVIWNMGRIAAVGGEHARTLFRDVLVASASVPGVFSPVLIRVKDGDKLYEEMHVDGGMSSALLVAPEAAFLMPLDPARLRDMSVYMLMNFQVSSLAPSTTDRSLEAILTASFQSTVTHMARSQIIEVKQFTGQYRMPVSVTAIPPQHPKLSELDFSTPTLLELFNYGERCAEKGQLWTGVDQVLSGRAAEGSPLTDRQVPCPGEPARQRVPSAQR
jgi:predicted patatin/cPLA2 family phospholipase